MLPSPCSYQTSNQLSSRSKAPTLGQAPASHLEWLELTRTTLTLVCTQMDYLSSDQWRRDPTSAPRKMIKHPEKSKGGASRFHLLCCFAAFGGVFFWLLQLCPQPPVHVCF
uniref:Uncharacterized protein n=1 Tax=Arundo donax TaxID=35708 RepID=A0A0A8XW49_ARUDO